MDFKSALEYLDGFISYESKSDVKYNEGNFNLDRVRNFLHFWKVDYSNIEFAHVAGSKGKGSVCHMIAGYLWKKNEKAGLYTSPHILDVRERIQINGAKISERLFGLYMGEVKKIFDEHGSFDLTYFEILTAIALKFFVDENVKYAVMETGLGGRLDATNIISSKVAVLTRVEEEHTDILGDDLEQIIDEKLGITKGDVPLVIGEQSEDAENILRRKLKWRKGVYFVGTAGDKGGGTVDIRERNAAAASKALEVLAGAVDKKVFSDVVADFYVPGRFDVREIDGKVIVFDMAHTPASIGALVDSLKASFPGRRVDFLVSVLRDKKVAEILRILSEVTDKIVFTTLPFLERSVGETEFERVKVPFRGEIIFKPDCKEAFFDLLSHGKKEDVLVVTGSHFLVGEILRMLESS